MDFPFEFLRAALLKLLCWGKRSSAHTCDNAWRMWALRVQVLQKPGDLGHKDLSLRPSGGLVWLQSALGGTHLFVGQHNQRQPGLLSQQRVQLLACGQQA